MRRLIPYCIIFFLMAAGGAFGQTKDSTNYNNEPMENVNTLPGKKDTLTKASSPKTDSLKAKKEVRKAIYGKARTAAILSAVIPGAGQAYNKQYWKMPVIYAALGGLGYWVATNQREYKKYSNQLRDYYRDYPNVITTPQNDPTSMIALKHQHQKSRDLGIILCGVVYILNVVDANVSAHLKTFDVSDDLSLQLKPYYNIGYQNQFQTGLSVKLSFK